jgi:hypothetical protein
MGGRTGKGGGFWKRVLTSSLRNDESLAGDDTEAAEL